ncbi:MAG TPA: carbamoyltransferase C-terminal domain-containing protein [Alphaproteobacteria bacterium]|nr:carbamoyltransferase C-terminal domain-containing protein [Alphaproteobacteria bacterium]
MLILGIHPAWHDSAAVLFDDYRLVAAVQTERLTRVKGDGDGIPEAAIDEVLAIGGITRREVDVVAMTRGVFPRALLRWGLLQKIRMHLPDRRAKRPKSIEGQMQAREEPEAIKLLNRERFRAQLGFRPDVSLYFCNHHFAHALTALFFTEWDDALVYTADGGGDNVQYSVRRLASGELRTLFGDDRELLRPRRIDSLGMAYGLATSALGFRMLRHEGKLTGLAAFGQPVLYEEMARHFRVDDAGRIDSDYRDYGAMARDIRRMAAKVSREDMAASIQKLLEDYMLLSAKRLLQREGGRRLALAGGVFANVRLNRLMAEATGVEEVFIFPAMGDEGLAAGGALEFLLQRDGLGTWLERRYRLESVSLGRDYDAESSKALSAAGACELPGPPAETAARLLARGLVGALYLGRMEYGPRALGNRSILANPAERGINDDLNKRLERSEFMPFAPVVAAEDARAVFDISAVNAYACRFMTITCAVRPEWRERLAGVVHVDGTARPQIIERRENPLYYDILSAFKALTGLPALVNTSFNVHEEPIVNAPQECLKALSDGRVDFVITAGGVYAADAARALTPLPQAGEGALRHALTKPL